MHLALLQMSAVAGDVAGNLERIERAAGEAAQRGAWLLIAPELALGGYGAEDHLYNSAAFFNGRSVCQPGCGGAKEPLFRGAL